MPPVIQCRTNALHLERRRPRPAQGLPDDRARSSPAITRSLITARSNSENTPNMPNRARPGCWCRAPADAERNRHRGPVARPAAQSGLAATGPADTPTMLPRCRTRAGPRPSAEHPAQGACRALGATDALVAEHGHNGSCEPSSSRLLQGLQLVLHGLASVRGRDPYIQGGAFGCRIPQESHGPVGASRKFRLLSAGSGFRHM